MIPSRCILAFCVCAAMNALAHAQTARALLRPSRPLESVSVDLTSGTVTRGAATHGRSAATVLDFDNLDLTGFLGTDTGGGFCEWFDAGTKGAAGNRSDLMDSIVFAYCSAMKDPSLGGPGGAVIPLSFALLCQHFAAQAVTLGTGGMQLISAVEGTLGTF
jgi:hypothetical protein